MDLRLSRRQFLKGAAIAGVGMALPLKFGIKDAHAFYQSPGLQKWLDDAAWCYAVPRKRFRWQSRTRRQHP